jgi:hypothetical protein
VYDTVWSIALLLHFPRKVGRARVTDGFARAVLASGLGTHAVDAGLETGLLGGPCG